MVTVRGFANMLKTHGTQTVSCATVLKIGALGRRNAPEYRTLFVPEG